MAYFNLNELNLASTNMLKVFES